MGGEWGLKESGEGGELIKFLLQKEGLILGKGGSIEDLTVCLIVLGNQTGWFQFN